MIDTASRSNSAKHKWVVWLLIALLCSSVIVAGLLLDRSAKFPSKSLSRHVSSFTYDGNGLLEGFDYINIRQTDENPEVVEAWYYEREYVENLYGEPLKRVCLGGNAILGSRLNNWQTQFALPLIVRAH
ncbi:MAG: hypothetical protein KDE09_11590 [Anaerolineales bacterium]|nr:hypothetical protein [Anaerolineales bacterium]MCB0018426.1 hypothetical protein [Anaerolineales bacterium]MCB0026749.1 hypothetical protein [Anaerolineales bacterium]